MKVKDARTKICPFMMIHSNSENGVMIQTDGGKIILQNYFCTANECMAWSYSGDSYSEKIIYDGEAKEGEVQSLLDNGYETAFKADDMAGFTRYRKNLKNSDRNGYCKHIEKGCIE